MIEKFKWNRCKSMRFHLKIFTSLTKVIVCNYLHHYRPRNERLLFIKTNWTINEFQQKKKHLELFPDLHWLNAFNLPSQYLVRSKQTPSLRHLNLSRPHAVFGQLLSSSPSGQSGKPSQTYDFEMHRIVLHMNWFFKQRSASGGSSIIGMSVIFVVAHPSSSELSPQSLTPSHFHQCGTHLSLVHWNIQSWHVGIILSIVGFRSGKMLVVQFSSSLPFWQSLSPSMILCN